VNWDNKLTLEITGERPCVKSLKIEKTDKVPTIFLAGNSTVTDQENDPWASWGQMFPCFLKPNVVVANYAESGLTLASFKSQLRLEKVLSKIKPGDYVFIEFGHNDQKMNGQNDGAWKSYTDNFRFFIQEVKKKQANAVVVTSTCRRRFDESGKIVNTLGDFPEAARTIAKHENVMLIDLNAMSKDVFDALGVEPSKKAFVHYPANTYPGQDKELADNTHFSPYGAYVLAKCVVQGILNNNYKLKKYIYSDWKTFDPKNPDSLQDFKWYESPAVNVLKPDGN
jgi:lysophospholipase L1-like esterase